MKLPTLFPSLLASALALGMAAAPASAAALASAYAFDPDTAKAGQEFALRLTGGGFDCATSFSNIKVTVTADAILLAFLPQQLPKGCADTSHAYGPSFAIPGLKAGEYRVRVDRLDRDAIVEAGTLSALAHPDWYLKRRDVAANAPFELQLLRDDIGNCQTGFSHDSIYVMGGSIFARFVMESHPERVCAQDLRPFGPSFPMPALAPGLYPVVPMQLAPCQVLDPPCLLPIRAPYPTDTLVVSAVVAIRLSALRQGAPRVEVGGGYARFALPEGPRGTWQADLIGLDGRMLATARATGSPGERMAVPVPRAKGGSPALLRLTSPAGDRRYVDLVR